MPQHKVTLPPTAWPDDLRERFEKLPGSAAQKKRLGHAFGRWLKIATDHCFDPRDVTRESWEERTKCLPKDVCNDVRRSLAAVFPQAAAALYEGQYEQKVSPNPRARLGAIIARNLARFPEDWRLAAEPLFHVGEEGFGDGVLVEAWAASTIKRCLESGSQHFDYCRARDFAVDITRESVRAKLREDQARVGVGERRIGGVDFHVGSLVRLAAAVRPERHWDWLKTASQRMKKLAAHHGSRSASRAVDAAELRAAGQQLLDKADAAHAAARNLRDFVKAHTRARTALTMILLAEAPIRITSRSEIELHGSLLADLDGLFLGAESTKEGGSDRRTFSATLIDAIGRYRVAIDQGRDIYDLKPIRPTSAHEELRMLQCLQEVCGSPRAGD